MRKVDLHAVTEIGLLLRAASRAEILPRFRRLTAGDIRAKDGPLDLVTAADEAAERMVTAGLLHHFPGAVVIGEEAVSADPAVMDRLADAELAFVLDPIDGTSNFAAGLTMFGSMVAVIVHGETVAAVIHDPVGDDSAFALRGEGAWIERPDGSRTDLRVAPAAAIAAMTGAASWRYLPPDLRERVCRNLPKLAATWSFRCAAHEYRMLAAGHCHFLLYNRMLPWDHAPGVLLHQEAGGFSARFDGAAYNPLIHTGGLICAPDRASWSALREALLEMPTERDGVFPRH